MNNPRSRVNPSIERKNRAMMEDIMRGNKMRQIEQKRRESDKTATILKDALNYGSVHAYENPEKAHKVIAEVLDYYKR